MKLAAMAILALTALQPAAQAQLADGCQPSCSTFGDQQSCTSCIGRKAFERDPPSDVELPAKRKRSGVGQEDWQQQKSQEELRRSKRLLRDFCVDTGDC